MQARPRPPDGVSRNGRIEESIDGGQTWRPASLKLQVPWPEHMVERFADDGTNLIAVLSNGQILWTSLQFLSWQPMLAGVSGFKALAVLRV